jgi:hypothetical protein
MKVAPLFRPDIVESKDHWIAQDLADAPVSQLMKQIGRIGCRKKEQKECYVCEFAGAHLRTDSKE